ncbi:PLP-dependent aminotransferase family protein, partial [Staphylococcus haemolyticus]
MNQAISNKEKAFYIDPTFNNPTGQSLSRRSREEIITYSRRHNMPIIEDDIYRDIWFDEPPLKPIKSLDNTGNVLHISSFSKSIAPAIRIGWLIASEKVIEQLADIRMQIDYGSSILSQMVVYELLTSGEYDDHVSRLRTILKDKRDYMLSILNDTFSDIATWDIPKGGFFIWVTFRGDINIKKLFAELINKEKILFNPGFIYGGKANTLR